jgi:hypothetical protein
MTISFSIFRDKAVRKSARLQRGKRPMNASFGLFALLALWACAPALPPQQVEYNAPPPTKAEPVPRGEDTCNRFRVLHLVGQSSTAVARAGINQPMRIIARGTAVTQDFLPERLNFHLDNAGQIIRITCG